jgi:uncharacterized protein YjdB
MNSRLVILVALGAAAVIGACKDGSEPTGPDSLYTQVVITPSTGVVAAGETLQLSAAVSGPPGTPQGVTWISVDTALASVNATGLVTGKTGGTARIRARWVLDSTNFTDAHIIVTEGPIVDGAGGIFRRK